MRGDHAMEAGAVVCWPDGAPLYTLMLKRVRDGRAAFDSEQQNDPVSGEDAPFAELIERCVYTVWPEPLIWVGVCDPSLGKMGNARDPSAILVGGIDAKTGTLYVAFATIRKRVPDRIIEDILAAQERYRCVVWGIEAVQFQEFLRTELIRRSAERGCPLPAVPIVPHTDKALRIEGLQPHLANGFIRLHPSLTTLIDQLRHWPKADHDDGPDALEMLWKLAQSRRFGVGKPKTRGRRDSLNELVKRYAF